MKGFHLDTPVRAQEQSSLLESGYASDLPLTSPETAGTTPSQTDWGGLTSSSSERLDSMMESPLSLQQQATVKYLPQVCLYPPLPLSCHPHIKSVSQLLDLYLYFCLEECYDN